MASSEGEAYFETHIRPLFAEHCYGCHGGEKVKGGLRLNRKIPALKGGEAGMAIVPGDAEASLLWSAVSYQDASLEMPPKYPLSTREKARLRQWIAMGAPWPEDSGAESEVLEEHAFSISDEDRAYWAFRPIGRPEIPGSGAGSPSSHPIDQLVSARLEEAGIAPNPPASKPHLIRRLAYDLAGLPPTYTAVRSFVQDTDPKAYERLIENYLASPRFGERWGRHWLDVTRFAQTNGYERDDEKPEAWRYRDYIIRSLNNDKPYDRFVMEHIAGDELPDRDADAVIATGFYRLGVWDDEPDDPRAARYDGLDDILKTTGETFLGMTLGCARCHDHMFDPIAQKDYYSLLAVFHNVRAYERPRFQLDSATYAPLASLDEVDAYIKDREARQRVLESKLASLQEGDAPNETQELERQQIEENLSKVSNEPGPFEYALAVRESGPRAPETHVLIRGNAGRKGDRVSPRVPEVFGSHSLEGSPDSRNRSSGRRLAFARWVASPDNPLTARVMANRIWAGHFGRGLVATPNDFGAAGSGVSHPELLDYLASYLIENDWSLKALHLHILTSETYQRSSATNLAGLEQDPDNTQFWRQDLRRLEAEPLRDAILVTAGSLNLSEGGRGVFSQLSGEVIAGGSRPGRGWGYSAPEEQARRSVYLFVKRTMGVPLLQAFDYTNTEGSVGSRPVTTVAPQALTLLNSAFMRRNAEATLARLGEDERVPIVQAVYRRLLARDPEPEEQKIAERFIAEQTARFSQEGPTLRFSPIVPAALSEDLFRALPSDAFVQAPGGWQGHKGQWGNGYESIIYADPEDAPYAALSTPKPDSRAMRARFAWEAPTQRFGILLGPSLHGPRPAAVELVVEPSSGRLLVRYRTEADAPWTILGETSISMSRKELAVHWVFDETSWTLFLNDSEAPALSSHPPGLDTLEVGVRIVGGPVSIREWSFETEADSWRPAEHSALLAPKRMALRELITALWNTNEFIYID